MADNVLCQTHYEVQVLQGSHWLIECVMQQRGDAFVAAREIFANGQGDGVRVVKEIYRPLIQQATALTLYEEIRPTRRRAWTARAGVPPPAPPETPPTCPVPPPAARGYGCGEIAAALSIVAAAALALGISYLLMFA
jgi:hypothetical protein